MAMELEMMEAPDEKAKNMIEDEKKAFNDKMKVMQCRELFGKKEYTTGLTAIGTILSLNPKELFVTGITCYSDLKYNNLSDFDL